MPVHDERRALDAGLVAVEDLVDLDVELRRARPSAGTSAAASRPSPATRCRRRPRAAWRPRRCGRTRRRAASRARASRDRPRASRTARASSACISGSASAARSSSIARASPSRRCEGVEAVELGPQPRELGGQPLAAGRVVPERRIRRPAARARPPERACRRRQRNSFAAAMRSARSSRRSVWSVMPREVSSGPRPTTVACFRASPCRTSHRRGAREHRPRAPPHA